MAKPKESVKAVARKPLAKKNMKQVRGGGTNTGTGKVTMQDIHITKVLDKSSP